MSVGEAFVISSYSFTRAKDKDVEEEDGWTGACE